MNTALSATAAVTVGPRQESTWLERMANRAGVALVDWSSRERQPRTREQLAEIYERRVAAHRLRESHATDVTLAAASVNRIY